MRRAYLLYLAGLLVAFMGLLAGPTAGMAAYGDYGSTVSAGGLNQPAKVAVDSANGNVYVTDAGNKAVKRYNYLGTYDSGFALLVAGTPVGIATNGTNIFVGDDTNNCVWIYDMNGALADLSGTGTSHKLGGASGTSLLMPNTVTVAPSGHMFVVDGDSDKIYIYNSDGSANSSFGTSYYGTTSSSGTTIRISFPSGLAMAGSTGTTSKTQTFYLGDQGNNKVQKLYYIYNDTTKVITTAPTYVQNIGTGVGDTFGKFLRISDVVWDPVYSRLAVVDSLQMVVQLFDSAGATMSQAFNYSGGVQGYLNVPTGAAISMGNCYVTSNQGNSLVLFAASSGTAPTSISVDPTVDITPSTTPETVNYTVNDSGSATVTMSFYYEKVGTSTRVPISVNNPVTLVGGTYSGSFTWNWAVDPGPVVGSYKVIAVAVDDTANVLEQYSAGSLLVVTPYDGCTNYTNAHFALYGPALSDYDGDTFTNCDEVNGTFNTNFGNQPTNMGLADSDSDGLADNAECLTHSSNPNNPDTDGGGTSDYVELNKGTNMLVMSDDFTSEPDLVNAYFAEGVERYESFIGMLNNRNTDTVYADLALFNLDGSLAKTIYAVKFVNGQSVKKMFSEFGVPEGSVEIRTTSGPALSAFVAGYKMNKAGNDLWDCGHSDSLQYTLAKRMSIPYVDDAAWGFTTYVNLKNATNNTVSVDVEYNVVWPLAGPPAQVINKNYTVLPHQTLHLRPSAESIPGEVVITASSSSQCLMGTGISIRSTGADPDVFDYGSEEAFQSSPSTISYCALVDSEAWRFRAWYSLMNPLSNPADSPSTFDAYMAWPSDGNPDLIKKYTKGVSVVKGNYYAQKPAVDMVAAGTPNPNGGEGSFTIKSDLPLFGNLVNFRWNGTLGDGFFDYGFAVQNSVSTSAELYAPYFDENLSNRYKVWTMICNPSDTLTANVTISYLDMNGNLLPAASNPIVTSVPPRGNAYGRPTSAGIADGSRIGSTKVVATGAEIVGYQMWSKWNKNGDQEYFDYAFAYPMLPRPYPPAPVGFAVTATIPTQVTVAWDASPSYRLSGYNVYRSTTSGTGYTKVNGAVVTGTTYNDTTVSSGNTYYYVVKAVDLDSNESGSSGEARATP